MCTDKATKGYTFKRVLKMQQLILQLCFPSTPHNPHFPNLISSAISCLCPFIMSCPLNEKGKIQEGLWCSWCLASCSQSEKKEKKRKETKESKKGWWGGKGCVLSFSSEKSSYELCHPNTVLLSFHLILQHPSHTGCIIDRRVLTGDLIDVLRLTLLINRTDDYCGRGETLG